MKSQRKKRKGKIYPNEFKVPKTSRRNKKAFLNEQFLKKAKIEENNRRGKTRYLFKKSKDIKEAYHARMDTIKDRNAMDLTEAE